MLQSKTILIFDRDPSIALDLAVAVATAGGTVVGPATTVQHVRILANKTRLDGIIYDLEADDADSREVLGALVEAGAGAVVFYDDDPTQLKMALPQVAIVARSCPHPVLLAALDKRIGT